MVTQTLPQASQQGQAGRALRSGYRRLQARAIRDGEDLVSLDKSNLAELLAEANQLQEQVQRPREQAVDSEVFAHLTDRGVELAKKLAHGGKGHTAKDFLRRLKALYVHSTQAQEDGANNADAFNWAEMGQNVCHMFRTAPGVFCMVGPLDAQPKMRKAPVRHVKQQLAEVVRPDEVQNMAEQEKQDTDRNLDELWAVLRQHGSVPLMELVMNHHSFAQTVENLFSLSFLVRDGKVSLTKSERGALVTKVAERDDETESTAKQERVQFIINQSMEEWENWKKYVNPADCLLKHREPRDHSRPAPGPSARPAVANGAGPSSTMPAAGASGRNNGSQAAAGGSQRKGKVRKVTPVSEDEDSEEEEEAPRTNKSKRGRR